MERLGNWLRKFSCFRELVAIVHPEKTCQGKITLFWAVKFSGDQAIKRAMKPAKMYVQHSPEDFTPEWVGVPRLISRGQRLELIATLWKTPQGTLVLIIPYFVGLFSNVSDKTNSS